VLLKDLFAAAIEKVKGIMAEKNPELADNDEVAEAVGVGAIVFYYLTNNRIKDINFNLEDALSFDGNTGPYVQYTYARTCSVLEKAGNCGGKVTITCEEEATLLKTLCQYEERVLAAIRDYEPSTITRFILDVAVALLYFFPFALLVSALAEAATAVLQNQIMPQNLTNALFCGMMVV
jgi:arginyl-tRNA synthetase